jgi:hypothetical protein
MWNADQAHLLFLSVSSNDVHHLNPILDCCINATLTSNCQFVQIIEQNFPKNSSRRRIAAASRTLLRDIVAVASGLRPAFLLDYLTIEPKEVAVLVETTLTLIPRQLITMTKLCVLTLDACCLVANLKVPALNGEMQQHPLFIEFESNATGGGMTPRWANEEKQTAMQNKFKAVLDAVLAHVPPVSPTPHVPIIDLDSISKNIGVTMPTINGFFLGYPVCYAVHDMVNAESASRCLSTTTLKLYSVFTKLDEVASSQKFEEGEDAPLFAFSLPVILDKSDEWRERKGVCFETLRTQHKEALAAEIPWSRLRIDETTCMRGIAL